MQLTGDSRRDYRSWRDAIYKALLERIGAVAGRHLGLGRFETVEFQDHISDENGRAQFVICMLDRKPRQRSRTTVDFPDWYSYPDAGVIVDSLLAAYVELRDGA